MDSSPTKRQRTLRLPLAPLSTNNGVTGYYCQTCGEVLTRKSSAKRHCQRKRCDFSLVVRRTDLIKSATGVLALPVQTTDKVQRRTTAFSYEAVKTMLVPFIRLDEYSNDYVPMFTPIVGRYGNLETHIRWCVASFAAPNDVTEPLLCLIHDSAERWLLNSARYDVTMVNGKYRAGLQVFEGQDLNEVQQNFLYTFRHKAELLLKEVKKLLSFLFRRGAISTYDNRDDYSVPRLLMELLLESTPSFGIHPLLVEYCIMRAFRIDKSSQISMVSCGTLSSTFSESMSVCRAAVCSVLCSYEHNVHEHAKLLVERIRESPVLHVLAPMVRQLREVQRRKPKRRLTTLDEFGHVGVDQFLFEKDIWSSLVPEVVSNMNTILERICEGEWYKSLVDPVNPIRVGTSPSGDLFIRNSPNPMNFKSSYDVVYLDMLIANLEISFHGFGGGSMRLTELDDPTMFHVLWHRGTVYYSATPIKKFTYRSPVGFAVLRKLPPVIARYYLIYRALVRTRQDLASRKMIPVRSGRGYLAGNVISELFSFEEVPTMTQIRHLWNSISNYLFPNNGWDNFLSANKDASEMAGHSEATQRKKYGTRLVGGPEYLYASYHAALGDSSHIEVSSNVLSDKDIEDSIVALYGPSAKFKSIGQRQMLSLSSKLSNKHGIVNLPCGEGKSLAWIVPTLAREISGKGSVLVIVVLPYIFLTGYHYSKCEQEFDRLGLHVAFSMFTGSDIVDTCLPDAFSNSEGADFLPSIAFMSLEALECLVRYHSHVIEEWVKSKLLSRIFVDEVHTIISEEEFRPAYDVIRKLPRFRIPVIVLSGTIPSFLLGRLAKKLNLSVEEDGSDVEIIKGGDVLGSYPRGFEIDVQVRKTFVVNVRDSVLKHLGLGPSRRSCVHIIVASKQLGATFHKLLSSSARCQFVTADDCQLDQVKAAKEWADGEIDVLITTSIGIVGNENSKCCMVVVAGYLFSLIQVCQAICRLRTNQRTSFGRILVAVPTSMPSHREEADASKFKRLVENSWLETTDWDQYNKTCTSESVFQWCNDNSVCRLVHFSERFGAARDDCGVCDCCRSTPLARTAVVAREQVRTEVDMQNTAFRVVQELESRCLVCKRTSCVCWKSTSCLRCAGVCLPYHTSTSKCTLQAKNFMSGKGCYNCFFMRSAAGSKKHDFNECPVGLNLKALLVWSYKQQDKATTFLDFLKSIYGSKQRFEEWLVDSFEQSSTS